MYIHIYIYIYTHIIIIMIVIIVIAIILIVVFGLERREPQVAPDDLVEVAHLGKPVRGQCSCYSYRCL